MLVNASCNTIVGTKLLGTLALKLVQLSFVVVVVRCLRRRENKRQGTETETETISFSFRTSQRNVSYVSYLHKLKIFLRGHVVILQKYPTNKILLVNRMVERRYGCKDFFLFSPSSLSKDLQSFRSVLKVTVLLIFMIRLCFNELF